MKPRKPHKPRLRSVQYTKNEGVGRFKSLAAFAKEPRYQMIFLCFQN